MMTRAKNLLKEVAQMNPSLNEKIQKANYVMQHLKDYPADQKNAAETAYVNLLMVCEAIYDRRNIKEKVTVNKQNEMEIWIGGLQ